MLVAELGAKGIEETVSAGCGPKGRRPECIGVKVWHGDIGRMD